MTKKHSLFVRFMCFWNAVNVSLMCQECWRESMTRITVWNYSKTGSCTAGWCKKHENLAKPTQYQEQFSEQKS